MLNLLTVAFKKLSSVTNNVTEIEQIDADIIEEIFILLIIDITLILLLVEKNVFTIDEFIEALQSIFGVLAINNAPLIEANAIKTNSDMIIYMLQNFKNKDTFIEACSTFKNWCKNRSVKVNPANEPANISFVNPSNEQITKLAKPAIKPQTKQIKSIKPIKPLAKPIKPITKPQVKANKPLIIPVGQTIVKPKLLTINK
jgi:hypothetical protein